jgi:hypothetical protein
MNWRYPVYCVILSIATLLAMRDAQISGGFTAVVVIFLAFIVVLMIAAIEGACWVVRRIRAESRRGRLDRQAPLPF